MKSSVNELLAWGILNHLLGRDAKSARQLRECQKRDNNGPYGKLAGSLLNYLNRTGDDQKRSLGELVVHVGQILDPTDPALPKLGYEVNEDTRGRSRHGNKNNRPAGFSRDPFKRLTTSESDVALAAVLYLLRGHALFFCRPKSLRGFNAAKIALNDYHQAFQLNWRLYHQLDCNHHLLENRELTPYLRKVFQSRNRKQECHKSPFFVWNVFLLCDLFRGNIYRHIDYVEEAERFYRHAVLRFDDIHKASGAEQSSVIPPALLSITYIKGLFERSKGLFDMGHFLDSLMYQTTCLQYLLLLNNKTSPTKTGKLIKQLEDTHSFLKAEMVMPVFDKARVTSLYGNWRYGSREWRRKLPGSVPNCFDPVDFAKNLQAVSRDKTRDDMLDRARLANEILARMGFTLYTLRPRRIVAKSKSSDDTKKREEYFGKWLRNYFRFDRVWSKLQADPRQYIDPSALGSYCETMIPPPKKNHSKKLVVSASKKQETFGDDVYRRLAYLLRERVVTGKEKKRDNWDFIFYKSLFLSTTANIGNLLTIPRRNRNILMRQGYRFRREHGDLSKKRVDEGLFHTLKWELPADSNAAKPGDDNNAKTGDQQKDRPFFAHKLVVLRRYQSYNPVLPKPAGREIRGGGYLLLWGSKGIAIDPGYDFIQNLYDEGFSLADIDAVLVTHSHPDHDNDLSSLTTLLNEWNEFHEKTGRGDKQKIDLFLNESTHRKFAAWLQAPKVAVGRIILLPSLRWDKDSEQSEKAPIRGRNVYIDLREPKKRTNPTGRSELLLSDTPNGNEKKETFYNIEIEVIPAWHDDILGKTSAIGIKIHLYHPEQRKPTGTIAITGDTGAYGLWQASKTNSDQGPSISEIYEDCDVLVAHLGDVRMHELMTVMRANFDWSVKVQDNGDATEEYLSPLQQMLAKWYGQVEKQKFREQVREILNLFITLDLVPEAALRSSVDTGAGKMKVQRWLGLFVEDELPSKALFTQTEFENAFKTVSRVLEFHDSIPRTLDEYLKKVWRCKVPEGLRDEVDVDLFRCAFALLEFLAVCALSNWKYRYHLGVLGILELYNSMYRYWQPRVTGSKRHVCKIFVVGELPEELSSYRHRVAACLNDVCVPIQGAVHRRKKRPIRAFTGDIGLHVRLDDMESKKTNRFSQDNKAGMAPRIRCTFCNYNNEAVYHHQHYHFPEQILETPIKRRGGAMIYLCTVRDHHPENPDQPHHFLSRPDLRVV